MSMVLQPCVTSLATEHKPGHSGVGAYCMSPSDLTVLICFIIHLFIYSFISCGYALCHGVNVEVGDKFLELVLSFYHVPWGLNLGRQVPLATKPSPVLSLLVPPPIINLESGSVVLQELLGNFDSLAQGSPFVRMGPGISVMESWKSKEELPNGCAGSGQWLLKTQMLSRTSTRP